MLPKSFCLQFACIIFLFMCCAKGKAQVALSTPEQITVKDNAPAIKGLYDADALTWYAIYNDGMAIHVHLCITDSLQKRKIVQNGIELWIDSKGKKNKTKGIMFPLGSKAGIYQGGGSRIAAGGPPPSFKNDTNYNKQNADSELAQLVTMQTEMELKGFAGLPNGKQSLQVKGINVSLHIIGDTLMYDAIIPFNFFIGQQKAKSAISIGIFEKGIQLPGFGGDMDGPGDDMGGPPTGDNGMPPPGDHQPGQWDARRMFETNSIWYKYKPGG